MKDSYLVLKDFEQIKELLIKLRKSKKDFSYDFETNHLKPWRGEILGIGFSWEVYTGIYIPFRERELDLWAGDLEPTWSSSQEEHLISLIKDLLEQKGPIKFAHNFAFEYAWCVKRWGIYAVDTWDTLWYNFVKYPDTSGGYERRLSLDHVIETKYPDLSGSKDLMKKIKVDASGGKDLSMHYNTEKIGKYCDGDCDATLREGIEQQSHIVGKPFEILFKRRLMPAVNFVSRMSTTGFRVDREYLNSKRSELIKEKDITLGKIQDEVGNQNFNPASDKHLQSYFFNKLKLPPLKDLHLDAEVLTDYGQKYECPIAFEILEYRSIVKLITSYFDNVEKHIDPITGKVHADIKLWGTVTGRLSIKNPALQTLPSRAGDIVKRMFIADEGYVLVGGDYSQIELRLIAEFSQDPMLLKAYREGLDLHALTGSIIYGVSIENVSKDSEIRKAGKAANFAWNYLGGAKNILYGKTGLGNRIMGPEYAKKIGVPYDKIDTVFIHLDILESKAKSIRYKYFKGYAGLEPWSQRVIAQARKDKCVVTPYGRVRYLPDISNPDDRKRHSAERQAVNQNPQSTASDYLTFHFMDMIDYFDQKGWAVDPLLMVHDQPVMHVPEDHVDKVLSLVEELGIKPDEANLKIPMVLEAKSGWHLGEV